MLELFAGAGSLPVWVAGAAACVYALLHLTSPLAPVFAGLGAIGAWLAGDRTGWKAVAASIGGLLSNT